MADVQWWYAREDEQLGPVSPADLRRLAGGRRSAPADLVWREGMAEWAPAARIKGLFPDGREAAEDGSPPQPRVPIRPRSRLRRPKRLPTIRRFPIRRA